MKAIVQNGYGTPKNLRIIDIEKPQVDDEHMLVRVHATSINAGDLFTLKGSPWIIRFTAGFPKPKDYVLGWDMAGTVESVGSQVKQFQPGDEIYGTCGKAFAEFVIVKESNIARKPANLTFEQAAAVPTAGMTALQGLRDAGNLQPGQKVLINGASGGVGTYSVQIAKALGAEVSGVCSTRNVELVRSLGADHVFDYTQEDFTTSGQQYDLILDNIASRSISDLKRVLSPQGKIVPNSGHGGMSYVLKAFLFAMFSRQVENPLSLSSYGESLRDLKLLIEDGKVKPVIDKVFPFSDGLQAFEYLVNEHAQGKVVLNLMEPS
jgi:NADPH:quinone reductase-like Zn-dependent oxidoreductase